MKVTTKEVKPFHLHLLGQFRLEQASKPVRLPTRKVEALLAYLVLHPVAHSREKLAALFWGDYPDDRARASLRSALPALRKHLGKDSLIADRDTIRLNPGSALWVDALEFRRQAADFLAAAQPRPDAFDPDLYQGELLSDFYDEWIFPRREALHQLYVKALLRLVQQKQSQGLYQAAITLAERLLKVEPTHEAVHRAIMAAYLALGNFQAVKRQYEKCRYLLRDELGVEPEPETAAFYRRSQEEASKSISDAVVGNLPVPFTSFIGRTRETAVLIQRLPMSRLLTLTGPGGSGKTRLAIHVAGQLANRFPDGLWWVDLAALSEPAFVPQAALRSLGQTKKAAEPANEILISYLRFRHALLILDNCEHLILACAQLAETLLRHCHRLTILATSREALGVTGETIYPVPPLTPPQTDEATTLRQSDAVNLFVERATAVQPTFNLSADNAANIVQLCRRLDGLPLALELAAARIKVLSPAEIVVRLDDRFALLTGGNRAALPRQQTLRATIDWSYTLLDKEEQELFRCLAVFAGSFSFEAVEAICVGVVPHLLDVLARLVDKSLVTAVHRQETTRYRLLETIRQYAADLLWLSGAEAAMRRRHLDWCLQLAETAEPELLGANQGWWLARLEQEHANVSAALRWAIDNGRIEAGLRLGGALWRFWDQRGYVQEGRQWLEQLLALTNKPGSVHAKALLSAGILAYLQTDNETAVSHLNQSLALYQQTDDKFGISLAQHHLGFVAHRRGDYATARLHYEAALAGWRQLDHPWGIGETVGVLGQLAYREGDNAAARALQAESLAIKRQLGDRRGTIFSLWCLGNVAYAEKEYTSGRSLYQEALALAWEMVDHWSIPYCLEGLGYVAAAQEQWLSAGHLLAAAEALRETTHSPLPGVWQATFVAAKTAAQTNLGQSFAQTWADGREMPLQAAVAAALND